MNKKEIKKQLNKDISAINVPNVLDNIKNVNFNDYKGLPIAEKLKNKVSNVKKSKRRRNIFAVALSGVFTLAMTFGILSLAGVFFPRSDYTTGLQYNLIPGENTYEVSIGTATDKDIKIAPEFNGKSVSKIAKDGFMNTDIKSVKIPDSITVIDGDGELEFGAFAFCENLISVEISSKITSINDYAFHCCVNLVSIVIPNSVTNIGQNAFFNCKSLKSIELPNSINNIEDHAFELCEGLETITIESGNPIYESEGNCLIQKSDNALILGCKNSVIPNYVTSIKNKAFRGCVGLNSITITKNVIDIGDGAFLDCSGLENITVESGNPIYESEGNCLIRKSDNTLIIGCKNSVIPNSIMNINGLAFMGRDAESIIVENDNPIYKSEGNCLILKSDNTLIIGCKNSVIPNYVTSIGNSAFHSSKLISIELPSSITHIGSAAFGDCQSLVNIKIADSVMNIDGFAFAGCTNLTSIIIPSSVTNIGEYVFVGCINLTTIYAKASSQPLGWDINWNVTNCRVVWDYSL